MAIANATASSAHSGHGAEYAIDGSVETIWHSNWASIPAFPVTFTLTLREDSHVDFVRYIPRQDGSINGRWDEVTVAYSTNVSGSSFTEVGTFTLGASKSTYDFYLGDHGVTCRRIRFTIMPGGSDSGGKFASAAEIEVYDNSAIERALSQYFSDNLYTELKPGVTSTDGIESTVVKELVGNILTDAAYRKFRVGEYCAYETVATLQSRLKTNHQYSKYENPTGIYLKEGEACWVAVSGIKDQYPVKLKIKNWLENENSSSYSLRNGLNYIEATTEGNVFVDYYNDAFEDAPNVKVHFINAPVRGYWHEGMTNAEWQALLAGMSKDDNSILIAQSARVQLAYPISAWLKHCPKDVDKLMEHYEHVQWAQRDMMGLEKYGHVVRNRQLFYAVKSGLMAANNEGSVCNVNSLGDIMTTDINKFDFWGVGHEWGHNNQIQGFHWSGCGETTNNIYASWGQIHATPHHLRLEDEVTGIGEYSKMRGGRMQVYFEEALRKGVAWQLQDGPDYHGVAPTVKTVTGRDADGKNIGQVTTTSRNYDHFVKLVPFWQLNLWGTLAGKCPDIIPMVIESIRNTYNYTQTYNTNGKQQINWMKLACDNAELNLLPFFEKAGMLRPIHAYIEDYGAEWNIITEEMIADLKSYVDGKGYSTPTEELNYINGHNYHIYRDKLELNVTKLQGELNGDKVTILHSVAQNAVAFETYNFDGELIRITMYGLGSDDNQSFTQVLFPSNAAYVMAVGYDGERQKVYENYSCLLSEVKNCLENYIDPARVGYYMNEAALQNAYNIAKALYDEGDKELIDEAFATLYQVYSDSRIRVVEGCAYRLVNKAYQRLSMSVNSDMSVSGEITAASDAQLWYLEASTIEGAYYLKNKGKKVYLGEVNRGQEMSATASSQADACAYTLRDMGDGAWALVSGQSLHCSQSQSDNIVGWDANVDASQWYITAVEPKLHTLSVGQYGYAGLYLPYEARIPEGVKAYIVHSPEVDKCTVTLQALTGTVIPAYTAVIIKAEEGEYTFDYTTSAGLDDVSSNLLKGSECTIYKKAREGYGYYIFGQKDGVVGLYQAWMNYADANGTEVAADTGDYFKVSANKVYLEWKTGVAAVSGFRLSAETTGTDIIESAYMPGYVYTLYGQRVNKVTVSGIYIVDGKKRYINVK